MDRIKLIGGRPLRGEIVVSGAKNAALALMPAALLTDRPLILANLPNLADVVTMGQLLETLGVEIAWNGTGEGREITLTAARILETTAPYDLVRKMRASVLVLGPLLARCGRARVSLPGGCAIGARPIDIHLEALARLGAEIDLRDGYVEATAPRGLTGAQIVFPMPSVGATENILMAAVLARGETVIENAAREPEITDLANCLNRMGARIEGVGSAMLHIAGVEQLSAARHEVIPDRIEAGTYAIAAAITDGDVELLGARREHLNAAIATLVKAGVLIEETDRGLRVRRSAGGLVGTDLTTEPFPGFPTDLQAQFMALMTIAKGASMISETIFENRFMHVPELTRMGADIHLHGGTAMVRGVPGLKGAPVMATDLRASASLVVAGLAAEGETTINRVYHLDRGFESVEQKLAACGAEIARTGDST